MRYLTNFCRIIVGIIFIISGFVKTIDPIGFSYKLEEYFGSSVFNIPVLEKFALPMSIFFVIFEVVLGVLILLGAWKKITVYMLLILIVFFSFLTFYSAYFNKVTDCGCFGDALKLQPWVSFAKDIVLLGLILVLFYGIKYIKPIFSLKINIGIIAIVALVCCWVAYIGIVKLPLIDFRPYAVGVDLKKGMADGSPQESLITYTLKNKKTQEEIIKTSDEYINDPSLWNEGTDWEIIKDKEKIIKKAIPNSIENFSIECNREDITNEILEAEKVVVITVPFPIYLSTIDKAKLRKITSELGRKNITFVVLTSDPGYLAPLRSCMTDPTTLKTINRGNPGFMVLKKGVVIEKYPTDGFPSVDKIKQL